MFPIHQRIIYNEVYDDSEAHVYEQEGTCVKKQRLLSKKDTLESDTPLRTPPRTLSHIQSPLESPSSKATNNTRAMFKAIMVGRSGVGKSALGIRLLHAYDSVDTEEDVKRGVRHTPMTIGLALLTIKIEPDAANVTETLLWLMDTTSHQRFQPILRSFYRRQQICFLIYDCTDPTSVYDENNRENKHRLKQHYEDVLEQRGLEEPAPVFVVIGNKRDIADNEDNERVNETKRLVDKFISDIREQSDEDYPAIALNVPPVSALKDSHVTFQNILFQVSSVLNKSAHKPLLTNQITSTQIKSNQLKSNQTKSTPIKPN